MRLQNKKSILFLSFSSFYFSFLCWLALFNFLSFYQKKILKRIHTTKSRGIKCSRSKKREEKLILPKSGLLFDRRLLFFFLYIFFFAIFVDFCLSPPRLTYGISHATVIIIIVIIVVGICCLGWCSEKWREKKRKIKTYKTLLSVF